MKLNEKNLKHTDGFCPICKNSEYTLFDGFHGETYCSKCGYVLHSSTRNSIVEHEREAKEKEKDFTNHLNTRYLRSLVLP